MFVQSKERVHHVRWVGKPAGSEPASAVIFLHSLGADLRLWRGVVDHLLEDSSKGELPAFLLCDLPGHGKSPVGETPYQIESLADSLSELVSSLGLSQVVVCGLSVGGQLAQAWGLRHPEQVRGLCLAATAPLLGSPSVWQQRITQVREDGLAPIVDALLERWFSASYRQRHPDELLIHRNRLLSSSAEGYCAMLEALRDADLTSELAEISQPTLVLAGGADVATPLKVVEALAEKIPNALLHVLPGAGHTLAVEEPAAFAKQLLAFLAQHRLAGAARAVPTR